MKKIISSIVLAALLLSSAACSSPPAEKSSVRSASSSADKYAAWLDNRAGDSLGEVIVCAESDAASYGVDLSGFSEGGYAIKTIGGSTVIAGKDEEGLDKAVRYFAKYADGSDMNVTEGEGYRVKSVKIDGTDISEFTILLPDEIPEGAYEENRSYAAEVLVSYIEKACGAQLGITAAEGGRQIILKFDSTGEYGSEAFNISIDEGNIVITGGLKRGLLYGVYGFLEECIGYRFYTRGVEYLYAAEEISLENGYDHTEGTDTPFVWRDVYTYIDGKSALYPDGAFHNKYPGSVLAGHITSTWGQGWINRRKYGYGEGPDRNHSAYILNPSVPDLAAPCYTDEYIFEECLANLCYYVDGLIANGRVLGETMPKISISQNDSPDWCMCSDCMKVISQYGAQSATLINFINTIAEEVDDKYPGIEFWTLSYYTPTSQPPKNMPITENLTICYCQYLACNNHSVDGTECDPSTGGYKNIDHASNLDGWLKLTDNVDVWYYANHFNYSLCPPPNYDRIYEDIQYYAEKGVTGMFIQNEETTLGFDDLTSYLFSEMLWNPYMTREEYDALALEFCRIYYGDGSDYIYEYILNLEEAGNRSDCWCALSYAPFRIYDQDFMADNFDHFTYLFEKAIESCNSSVQEARLKRLSCHMYFNCITASYEDMYTNGSDEQRELLTARYKLMFDRLTEIKDTVMLGIFTDDTVPDVFNPDENPLDWLSHNNSSWGDLYEG